MPKLLKFLQNKTEKNKDKVKEILEESRIVIPGVQALIGFQLIAVFNESFSKLDSLYKYLHLASLALIIFATILLMSPPAFHRLAEEGKDTNDFKNFAGKLVMLAMIPFSIGICFEFFIVSSKILENQMNISIALSLGLFLLFICFWFIAPIMYKTFKRE